MIESPPVLICLTPIKNEAWILDRFLACASLWADKIIIADQCSTDESRVIAARYPKAVVIDNDLPNYDEGARQRLLIAEARRLFPDRKRLLLALDADEMLTANFRDSREWDTLLALKPGTVIRFEWVNILPHFETCWIPGKTISFGFMDDGSPHTGAAIHSTRLPTPDGAETMVLQEIKLLHYQYTNWERMKAKQRWYQCWERINHPDKRAVTIYRQYNFMDAWESSEIQAIQPQWLENYISAGIDMMGVQDRVFWWDSEILQMLKERGAEFFRRIQIWDVNWATVAAKSDISIDTARVCDPRTHFEKRVHGWLAATQNKKRQPQVRILQNVLRLWGW